MYVKYTVVRSGSWPDGDELHIKNDTFPAIVFRDVLALCYMVQLGTSFEFG